MKKDLFRFIKQHWLNLLILSTLGFLTYANTLWNGFISDDIVIISENKLIATPTYFLSDPAAIIRPFIYYVIYSVWGANPVLFHLLNIFFHVATCTTLYVLAYLMTKKKVASLIAISIFAVHPAISEGVTWISGGNYPQYAFLATLSFIFYITRKKYRYFLAASVCMFVLSLFSSQKAAVIPIVFIVYELCFGSIKKSWKDIAPFILIGVVHGIFYFLKIGTRITTLETDYYIDGGKFENPLVKIPFAITSYIQLLFFPSRLTLYHAEVMPYVEYGIRIGGLIVFIGVLYAAYKKDKHIFFWLLFFVINLLLVLTPLKVASTIAERYMYYASFGVIFATVLFFQKISKRFKINILMICITGAVIFFLMMRTFIRNFDWADELIFWSQTVKTSPNAFSVHNNLGATLARINEDEKAVAEFNTAIALNPRYADAYKNLGFLYLKHNDPDTALKYYTKALALNSHNWQFYNDMGAAYIAKQNYSKAEEYFLKALKLSPGNELLYLNLGRIYMMTGKKEKAEVAFRTVLQINPTNPLAAELLKQLSN